MGGYAADTLGRPSSGLKWTEGPLWLDNKLIFSDTVGNDVWSWSATDGLSVVKMNSGGCLGRSANNSKLSRHEIRLRKMHPHAFCPRGQHEPGPNGLFHDGAQPADQLPARRPSRSVSTPRPSPSRMSSLQASSCRATTTRSTRPTTWPSTPTAPSSSPTLLRLPRQGAPAPRRRQPRSTARPWLRRRVPCARAVHHRQRRYGGAAPRHRRPHATERHCGRARRGHQCPVGIRVPPATRRRAPRRRRGGTDTRSNRAASSPTRRTCATASSNGSRRREALAAADAVTASSCSIGAASASRCCLSARARWASASSTWRATTTT